MKMKKNILGVDIGGTKCAVIYGQKEGDTLHLVEKVKFPTTSVDETIANICSEIEQMMGRHGLDSSNTGAIGISCGGPLDSKRGVVMSPPNLPGWNDIPIVRMLEERFGIRTGIHNDANACALAEWKFGAGVGTQNMVFLTFGTGLGAGLILDGKLYAGTNRQRRRAGAYPPVGVRSGGIRQVRFVRRVRPAGGGASPSWPVSR